MSAPCTTVCTPMADVDDVLACGPCGDADVVLIEENIALASDLLFELLGHRFPGTCQDTVRPCGRRLHNDGPPRFGNVSYADWGFSSSLASACGCGSPRECGCDPPSELTLGGWPVTGITAVKVDGVVLDPSLYRVDDFRYLVRLPDSDGSRASWPCCQRLELPDTEPGTFSVTFTYGHPAPRAVRRAAAVYACQFTLACMGSAACRLPQRVTSIVRQGISMTVLDPFDMLTDGLTGLYEVDSVIVAYGPKRKARMAASVVNVDLHRAVRRAGT